MGRKFFLWTCLVAIALISSLVGASSFAASQDFDEPLKQIAQELAKRARQYRLHRVAVEPFTDLNGAITPVGRLLADELSSELATGWTIQVIDQHQLAAHLLKQRKTERLSALPKAELAQANKELGLDGVIAGSVVESANHIRLSARLIAVRTASMVAAAKATLPRTGFLAELAPSSRSDVRGLGEPEIASAQIGQGLPPEDMVLIPAGPFIFGEGDRRKTVSLPAFWIDQHEVTNGRYNQLRAIEFDAHKAHHPVTNVSWTQAKLYCQSVGKRLPTEEEWEKAARGTDGRLYPWGETYKPAFANAEGRLGGPATVGKFEEGRSPYGVYDMAGNVMEWTDSGDGQVKVLRGGSWASSAPDIRATARNFVAPAHQLADLGFRCAKDGPR